MTTEPLTMVGQTMQPAGVAMAAGGRSEKWKIPSAKDWVTSKLQP
jgi:hypothetical protein